MQAGASGVVKHKRHSHQTTRTWLSVGAACCLLWTTTTSAASHRILSMEATTTPQVNQGSVVYSLEVIFDRRPPNYWYYYDRANKRLVIECYDASVTAADFRLPRRSPFGSPRTQTFSRNRKSLTGEHSLILIPLEPGWRCEAVDQGDASVVVRISKKLKKSFVTVKKVPGYVVYPLIAVLAGAATVGIILLLPERS